MIKGRSVRYFVTWSRNSAIRSLMQKEAPCKRGAGIAGDRGSSQVLTANCTCVLLKGVNRNHSRVLRDGGTIQYSWQMYH